jgi:hypothetical protein
MLQHSNSANELLLRRKLEEQQAAELQQAIELQSRRLMGLQLLDLKSRAAAASTTAAQPSPVANAFTSSQPAGTTMLESPPLESGMPHNTQQLVYISNSKSKLPVKVNLSLILWPLTGEQLILSNSFAPLGKVNGSDKEESAGETSPKAAHGDQRWMDMQLAQVKSFDCRKHI